MTFQSISKIAPFETNDTQGHMVEGTCVSLGSLTPNFIKRQVPLQEREQTFEDNDTESLWNSTDLSTKGPIGFTRGHLYSPAFKSSNRMTIDALSTTQFFRMEANRDFVKKFNDNEVSNNVERHFENCAILRSDNDNSKIAFTKLTKNVKKNFDSILYKITC